MPRKSYLIIGGAGEAGQSAIEFLKLYDPDCMLIATTSENSNIPGADLILKNIKAGPELVGQVKDGFETNRISGELETIIYTPALGEVGFPVKESTQESIESALGISYYPMLDLETFFSPKQTIGYSAFYWLPHTLAFYGAMGFVKYKMDEWAISSPEKRKIIRAGTFFSKSVRGISIVLQRTMKSTLDPDLLQLKESYLSSGKKFQEFFLDYAWSHEKEFGQAAGFGSEYRPTTRADLSRGLGNILNRSEPIATVLGDWDWYESALPSLPAWFKV